MKLNRKYFAAGFLNGEVIIDSEDVTVLEAVQAFVSALMAAELDADSASTFKLEFSRREIAKIKLSKEEREWKAFEDKLIAESGLEIIDEETTPIQENHPEVMIGEWFRLLKSDPMIPMIQLMIMPRYRENYTRHEIDKAKEHWESMYADTKYYNVLNIGDQLKKI